MSETAAAPSNAPGTTTSQPAPTSKSSPPEVKYKVKIDGVEKEVSLGELTNGYQQVGAANKRFQEAATMRKQIDELVGGLSKQDLGTFKKLAQQVGPDKWRAMAEEYLLEHIEYERLPDDQKARIAAERRAKELEDKLSDKDKEAQEAQRAQATQVALQEIDTEIGEALKSYQGKVKPRIVARIVERMLANFSSKTAKLPAAEAAKIEFAELKEEAKDYLSQLSLDELRSILPKNIVDGLRKADLDLARGQFAPKRASTHQDDAPSSKKQKRIKTEDWFREKERRFGS